MMDELCLNIADIRIQIRCDQLPIYQENEPAYLPFLEDECCKGEAPDLKVQLEVGKHQDISGWSKCFDDGESWSIYRQGNEYAMYFTPRKHGKEPLWVAQYSQECTHVVIKCSERLVSERDGKRGLLNPFRYPLDQHLIMYHLAQKKGILIHAAGFIHSERGLIFPGRSGAGKSTLTRHLSNNAGWHGLSDDRMLIRIMGSKVRCFGTPWPGEEGTAKNESEELSGVLFLCHAKKNELNKLTPQLAVQKLMPVVSIPWYDEDLLANLLPLCSEIISQIPTFELCFKPTDEVGEFLVEHLVAEMPS